MFTKYRAAPRFFADKAEALSLMRHLTDIGVTVQIEEYKKPINIRRGTNKGQKGREPFFMYQIVSKV